MSTFITETIGSASSARTPTIERACFIISFFFFLVLKRREKKRRVFLFFFLLSSALSLSTLSFLKPLLHPSLPLLTLLCSSTEHPGSSRLLSTKLMIVT